MNWTLPLLFILLSPGFLVSLGSKGKMPIITILIHALIFTILINVYEPVFEGFQEVTRPYGAVIQAGPGIGQTIIPSWINPEFIINGCMVDSNGIYNPGAMQVLFQHIIGQMSYDILNSKPPPFPPPDNSTAASITGITAPLVPVPPGLPSGTRVGGNGVITIYQANTLALSNFFIQSTFGNNIKDLCAMNNPNAKDTLMPWVSKQSTPPPPTPPVCPNPPTPPECKKCPEQWSCTIM